MRIKQTIAATLSVALMSAAQAGTIVSAVSATILSGGPGVGSIADTYNQFGLFTDYTSGVTDYDTYFAANPLHDVQFDGQEWFSNSGTSTAAVSYDLGSVQSIQGMALWNEDASGIGSLNLLGSADGTTWFSLLSNLSPTNNPLGVSYGADLYNWAATDLRYVRLDMSNCPQPNDGGFKACSIGEVAFNAAPASTVPETSSLSLALMGVGLVGAGFLRRRPV